MKLAVIPLFALLVLNACGARDEDEIEKAIRDNLSERGTVIDVQVRPQADGNMTGFAVLRNHAGTDVRLDCTVEREGGGTLMKQGFTWRCQPAEPGGDRRGDPDRNST